MLGYSKSRGPVRGTGVAYDCVVLTCCASTEGTRTREYTKQLMIAKPQDNIERVALITHSSHIFNLF